LIHPALVRTQGMTTPAAPSATTVAKLASRWAARHPASAERIERAVALVANVEHGDRSHRVFFVEGSQGHRYMVRVDWRAHEAACTCPDAVKGNRCKHRWAAALFVAARKADAEAAQGDLF